MKPIRAIVVDDEPPARRRLRALLAREPDVEVIAECENGPEAVLAIQEQRPDLLFLDVQMPEMDGFEVLRMIGADAAPAIIFVTAFDAYAVKAFDVHAVDYILKPVGRARFAEALVRARSRLHAASGDAAARLHDLLADVLPRGAYLKRLVIRDAGRIRLLPVTSVDWIGSADNYAEVHAGGAAYLMRATLKELEEKLDPDHFARVHRSALVAIDRIRQLEPWSHGDYQITLHDGTRIPASRTYEQSIRRILGE